MQAQVIPFKTPPRRTPEIEVGLIPILDAMGRNESKAETKRLFSVLVNALYVLNVIEENEWEAILTVIAPEQVVRRQP